MSYSFKGGVVTNNLKELTAEKFSEKMPTPEFLYYPLCMNLNNRATLANVSSTIEDDFCICRPVVKPGDEVFMGQVIGISDDENELPLHSTVSGMVSEIRKVRHQNGGAVDTMIVKNDFKDTAFENIAPTQGFTKMPVDEKLALLKSFGICGMGGTGYPTYLKIRDAVDKTQFLIINGIECEPILTSDHRAMLEHSSRLIKGIEIVMSILGIDQAFFAVAADKHDVIKKHKNLSNEKGSIVLRVLKAKYPQGDERILANTVLGLNINCREMPQDKRCLVLNVQTVIQIAASFLTGMPCTQRIVTLSGTGYGNSKNAIIRIGTLFEDVISFLGGFKTDKYKLIAGGPIIGFEQTDLLAPVMAYTKGLLSIDETKLSKSYTSDCIRCGRCAHVCPARLTPMYINQFISKDEIGRAHV